MGGTRDMKDMKDMRDPTTPIQLLILKSDYLLREALKKNKTESLISRDSHAKVGKLNK